MMEKIVNNWILLAEYDLETDYAMLEKKRYLYVPFTCQQSIEKILKAIFVKEKNETPPYTHNLLRLIDSLSFSSSMNEDQLRFLEKLNSYYIESRYTEEIHELNQMLTPETSQQICQNTKELFQWLKNKAG
ncbi:HEPN domain-containing protein [Candidatus Sumerlaeota bacterium]|nr:HEPN domain-containing protein [Candidatus Sumerlaeota bacterium]